MFCLFRLEDDDQVPMKKFDRKKKPMMSVIKEYREISQRWDGLKKGRYVLVPSCKKPKETGKYYLNIYFSEGEEDRTPNNGRDFLYFKATYLNPYKDENKKHLFGEVIQEEDEDEIQFDADFKEALRIK